MVVVGAGERSQQLVQAALRPFRFNKAVLHLTAGEAVPQKLPPALAETIPSIPGVKTAEGVAVVCSGFTCQPPVAEPGALSDLLQRVVPQAKAS